MKGTLTLLFGLLVIAGCSSQPSGENSGEAGGATDVPDYEVVSEQRGEQVGFAVGNFNVSTGAESETDLRIVARDIQEDNPDLEAISYAFVGEGKQGQVEQTGGGQYFASREAIRALGADGYTDSDIDSIMEEDGGFVLASISDVLEETTG